MEIFLGSLTTFHRILLFKLGVDVPGAVMSTEVGYTPMDLKPPNIIWNCSHRNIKLLRDNLAAFTFDMVVLSFSF